MDQNEVLATTEESVVSQVTESVVSDDDGLDTGHKIGFYIILGLIGLSGIGIPILAFLLVKEHKKRKQLEDTLNAKATTETPAAEEPKAEEAAPEAKAEEPAPEKKKK